MTIFKKSLICRACLPAGRLPRALRSKAFKAAAECRNGWHCGHMRLFLKIVRLGLLE